MDYEKAYKNALEWASGIYPKAAGAFKEDLEHYFPELAESEDERIRKAIVEFFELQDDNTTYSFIPKKDILAWLEKQGKGSLTALLAQMPCVELVSSANNHYRAMWKNKISEWYENAVDACMELIEREEDKE